MYNMKDFGIFGVNPERVFNDLFKEIQNPERAPFANMFASMEMKIDSYEYEDKYVLEIDLPGYKKEDVQILPDKDILRITAKRTLNDENVKFRERFSGELVREMRLLPTVDASNIKAKMEDGILTITLPKKVEVENNTKVTIE